MKALFYIALATILTYATSLACGRLLARALRLQLDRFLAFVAGSAVLSALVFLLTACGLAYKAAFIALAAVIIGAAAAMGPRRPFSLARLRAGLLLTEKGTLPRGWVLAFWFVYLAFGWYYLSQALAPETSPDGILFHVGLVTRYLRDHRLARITTSYCASYPQAVEMLFLFAFSIGKHTAAAMVEFLFLAITPFGIISWARRAGYPVAGVAAALLFYAAPVVGRDGTVAYVDVATAGIAFALFYALQLWREQPSTRLLVLAGLIAGLGAAAKYTQIIGILYGMVVIGFVLWRSWNKLLKSMATFGICASLLVAPWLIKNTLFVGNPVSPLLNRVFPNPWVYPSFETDFFERRYGDAGLAEIPLQATIRGEFEGLAGPVFLLLPLSLFAMRDAAGRAALFAFAVYLAAGIGGHSVRLLIPALVFLSLALALAVRRVPGLTALLVAAHAITCWPPVVGLYARQYAWRIEESNWAAALRRIPEQQYIRRQLADYDLGLAIARIVPPDARVLAGSISNFAYQPRELIVPHLSAYGTRVWAVLEQAILADTRPAQRVVFQFPHQALQRIRLALVDCGDALWAVSEVRVFQREAELAREPAWRLRARPNPWDVQSAFDNSPLTVWNARQYNASGAFLQIDFGRVQTVDRLAADLPRDLHGCRMRVESETAPGQWSALPATVTTEEVPYPERYRRAITEELKANGIGWIVLSDGHPLTKDFLMYSGRWGITAAAYENGFRLWRLD